MTNSPHRVVTGVALALCLSPAIAQEDLDDPVEPVRRYTVEFIVFEYVEDVGVGTEIFPPEEPEPIDLDVIEYGEDGIPVFTDATIAPEPGAPVDAENEIDPTAVGDAEGEDTEEISERSLLEAVLTLEDELTLQGTRDRLSLLDVYQPLIHAGWTQVSLDKETAEPVELSFFGETPDGLSGSLTLYLGRYLHLVVDLALDKRKDDDIEALGFDEPAFSFGDNRFRFGADLFEEAGPVIYRIEEDRIMRNNDVRYFDHPRFGVIAKVTRVEEPEPEDEPLLPLVGGTTQ